VQLVAINIFLLYVLAVSTGGQQSIFPQSPQFATNGTSQNPVAVARLSLSTPVMVRTMKVTDCPFCLAKRFCGNEGRDCNT